LRFSLRPSPRHVACVEFVELVTDYLEGVLPDRERRALEHHLSLCDPCGAYLEQMRETRRLTGSLQVDDVPEEGVAELLAVFRAYQAERGNEPGR
jgi:anti-sigma factor RsiW